MLREEDGTHWTAQGEGAGVMARKIMADAGHPNWYDERPPIAGGSGGVLEVGASVMAPKPPNVRDAPAKPWRSSTSRYRSGRYWDLPKLPTKSGSFAWPSNWRMACDSPRWNQ